MNWIQSLYETYENCKNMVGIVENSEEGNEQVPLLPICHTTQKAHIEITLDAQGEFRRARVLNKDEARTIIPCTEKSAGRTSGEAAHPLCDKLQYIAADYITYGGEKNHYFGSYLELLSSWIQYSAPVKVHAVFKYVNRGNIIRDLVNANVLFANEENKLYIERPVIKARDAPIDIFDLLPGGIDKKNDKLKSWQADAFVRWRVEGFDTVAEVWKSPEVIQSWIDYYSATRQIKSLCYVTGEESFTADQHPAKIRNDGDKAKLISSNDQSNFTYRGRFITPTECVTVGFETTQKAHSALRWLMSRQGYVTGDLGVIAWATSGAKVPQPTKDPIDELDEDTPTEGSNTADTAQDVANRLKKKISGYREKIGDRTDIVVMAVDSATTGRLSIVYYRALKGSEFLERIENWHKTCAWRHTYHYNEEQQRYIPFNGAPAPASIAEAAYGSRLDDKLKKATIKRLLPCIVDGQPIPRDLVDSVVRRASNRAGLTSNEWDKALTIACALYRKYKENKEVFIMALDEKRATRDYLYGRLLAIADILEERALFKSKEKRSTNAARYMQQFSQRPYQTWKQLHEALTPYMIRLGGAHYYKNLIAEIVSLNPEALEGNKPLTGEYLIGYYCQRQTLLEKSDFSSNEERNDIDTNK